MPTRAEKLDALENTEKNALIADGFDPTTAATMAAAERVAMNARSDAWVDEEHDRHVLGNSFRPLVATG